MAVTGGLPKANQAFRKTNAGLTLGRALFDPSKQFGLQPTQIANLLRQAGIPVSPGTQVTADVAQIIMSGGVISNNISTGASVQAIMAPSINILNASLNLMEVTGLLDPKEPAIQGIQMATDLALVMATGGLNVLADISLVFDVVGAIFSAFSNPPDIRPQLSAYASNVANMKLSNWFNGRENQQQNALATQFQDYQHNKISCFTMILNVAKQSPDLFDSYFPQIGKFIPEVTVSHTESFTIYRSILPYYSLQYGNTALVQSQPGLWVPFVTQNATKEFQSINNSTTLIQNAILEAFVTGPLSIYNQLQAFSDSPYTYVPDGAQLTKYFYPSNINGVKQHTTPLPRIPFYKLAVVSMFPPYFSELVDGYNILPFLQNLGLTPADLDDSIMNYALNSSEIAPGQFVPPSAGVSINGINLYPPDEQAKVSLYNQTASQTKQLLAYDQSGNIYSLLNNKICQQIIAEWGMVPGFPFGKSSLDPFYSDKDPSIYRKINNFWGALSLIEDILKDPAFAPNADEISQRAEIAKILKMKTEVDALYRKLQFLSVGRKMNANARANVAGFFGKKPGTVKFQPVSAGKLGSISLN